MRSSILQNIYILTNFKEVDYGHKVSWHYLNNDYELNVTYNNLRTISLKRV